MANFSVSTSSEREKALD